MAPLNIHLMTFLLYCSSLLLVLFSYFPEKNLAHFVTGEIESLSPAASYCTRTGSKSAGTTLELAHRFGPCSNLDENYKPSLADDQSRVDSIQARAEILLSNSNKKISVTIPVHSQNIGNYLVTVGLGTPPQNLTLIFDTGSPLTWTQCRPCASHCYPQRDPVYNPRSSLTYSSFSCDSSQCSKFGYDGYCYEGLCDYNVFYMDGSHTVGVLSKDRLTITRDGDDVFPGFVFGCGQKNIGETFGDAAGIMGLGRDPHNRSILYQTAHIHGLYFSYCLPSNPSVTGHLTFGRNNNKYPREKLKFTPFKTDPYDYFVEIAGISVGGTQLPIKQSLFTDTLSIVDSGTMITRLPMGAYVALRDAFKQKMGNSYPAAPTKSLLLDTCYDFGGKKKKKNITIPGVSFTFKGGAIVDLGFLGTIFFENDETAVGCLAFAGNKVPNSYLIFGITQQQTMEVVYDVAGQRIGFGPNGCK